MQVTNRYIHIVLLVVFGLSMHSLAQQIATELKVLSKGADLILTGKVVKQTSSWNEDRTRIYTKASIQVSEYIKGNNTESTVIVNYPGGEVGEIGETYSHMPSFKDNEEVLVFLKKDKNNIDYKVFNGEEGKISVIYDPRSGEKITTSNVRINSLKTQIENHINN
jgi:hypothetical protein